MEKFVVTRKELKKEMCSKGLEEIIYKNRSTNSKKGNCITNIK